MFGIRIKRNCMTLYIRVNYYKICLCYDNMPASVRDMSGVNSHLYD